MGRSSHSKKLWGFLNDSDFSYNGALGVVYWLIDDDGDLQFSTDQSIDLWASYYLLLMKTNN